MKPLRVIGIDPGLADAGWGVVEQDERGGEPRHVAHGVVRTAAGRPLAERLHAIHRELEAVIEEHAPSEAAVELLFFQTNVKTAIAVAQARGVAILATARAGLPLAEFTPLEIKLAVAGHGRAAKLQVQRMVGTLLRLSEIPRPDHAADALAVAICLLRRRDSAAERARRTLEEMESRSRASAPRPPVSSTEERNKALLAQVRRGRRRGR